MRTNLESIDNLMPSASNEWPGAGSQATPRCGAGEKWLNFRATRTVAGLLALVLTLGSPIGLLAQTATTTESEALAKALARIDALEKKLSQLEAAQAAQAAQPAPAPAAPASVVAAPVAATMADMRDHYPQVEFHLVGDMTYTMSNEKGTHDTFSLGDIDPIVTAKLSDHSGVLGDFVIASNHDGFAFEVERLLLQYKLSDAFKFEVGRFHTAIGYYNNTYHNGTYFQTTTNRPDMFQFEDNGGILPVHSNGVSVNGDLPFLNELGLRYTAELANGRDYDPSHNPLGVDDVNRFKAVNLALFARPDALPGTQFGVSGYHDTLTVAGLPRIDQLIFSAHAVYKANGFEWLNEGVAVRHAPKTGGSFETREFYTQVSQKFGPFRPYLRLDWRSAPEGDPILALIGQNTDDHGGLIGIRYDFAPMMALKAEWDHGKTGTDGYVDTGVVQYSFRY